MAKRKLRQRSYNIYASFEHWVPGWKGLLLVLVMLVLGVFIGQAAAFGMFAIFGNTDGVMRGASLLSYPLMFIPAMIYVSYQSRSEQSFGKGGLKLDSNNFAPFPVVTICISVIAATIAMAFVTDIFSVILPPMPDSLKEAVRLMTEGPLWISIVSVCIFAPFFEEWLCRGVVLRGMLQRVKPIWAIVISAAVFALIHLNVWQGIPAFFFGLLFGFVYYRTGSLKLTMLMHFTNNAFSLLLSRMSSFEGADSFLDVMDAKVYALAAVICLLWIGYFILRLLKIPIPFGRHGNFDTVDGGLDDDLLI
ncbi:MAG: CPBP family intramembrane metalloprotease [Bacteroidales bacterium]|nr:CPBP family intramembrane metalloprotease [Bacteroidales bacterium]